MDATFPPIGDVSLDPLLWCPVDLRDRRDDIVGLPADLDHQTASFHTALRGGWRSTQKLWLRASRRAAASFDLSLAIRSKHFATTARSSNLNVSTAPGGLRRPMSPKVRVRPAPGQPAVHRHSQARFPHLPGDVLNGGLLLPRGRGRQCRKRGWGRPFQPEAELIAKNECGRHRAHLGERCPFGHLQSDPGLQRAPQFPAGAF